MRLSPFNRIGPVILYLAGAIYLSATHTDWQTGFLMGIAMCVVLFVITNFSFGAYKYYRRWYLMCRNELERIDPNNEVLRKIGPRTSKREKWEENNAA